jgi:ankyrin repeat protein
MSINPELLVKAAFNGDNNLVESLIRSGADINAESSYLNPLHAAIEN